MIATEIRKSSCLGLECLLYITEIVGGHVGRDNVGRCEPVVRGVLAYCVNSMSGRLPGMTYLLPRLGHRVEKVDEIFMILVRSVAWRVKCGDASPMLGVLVSPEGSVRGTLRHPVFLHESEKIVPTSS